MVIRTPKSNWNLSNFMRVHLYSAFATLKIGNDILFKEEGVKGFDAFIEKYKKGLAAEKAAVESVAD